MKVQPRASPQPVAVCRQRFDRSLRAITKDSGRETSKLEGRHDFYSGDSHLRGSIVVNSFLLDPEALEAR